MSTKKQSCCLYIEIHFSRTILRPTIYVQLYILILSRHGVIDSMSTRLWFDSQRVEQSGTYWSLFLSLSACYDVMFYIQVGEFKENLDS